MKILKILIPIIVIAILIYLYIDTLSLKNLKPLTNKKKETANIRSIPNVSLLKDKFQFLKNNFNFILNPNQNYYYTNISNLNPYSIAIDLGFSGTPINNKGSTLWSNSKGRLIYSNNTYFENLNEGKKSNIQNYISSILYNTFNMQDIKFVKSENIVGNTYVYKLYPVIGDQFIYTNSLHRLYESITLYSNNSIKSFSILPLNLAIKNGENKTINLTYKTLNLYPLYISNITEGKISNIDINKVHSAYYFDLLDKNIIPMYMIFGNVVIINRGTFAYEGILPKIRYN